MDAHGVSEVYWWCG